MDIYYLSIFLAQNFSFLLRAQRFKFCGALECIFLVEAEMRNNCRPNHQEQKGMELSMRGSRTFCGY
jgi:hypothetical protein